MKWFLDQAKYQLGVMEAVFRGPVPTSAAGDSDPGKVRSALRVFGSMALAAFLTALLCMFITFRLHVIQVTTFACLTVLIEYAMQVRQDYSGGRK